MANEANLRRLIGSKASEASLAGDSGSTPDLRQDGDFANTPFTGTESFEREEPPKDYMRRYWRQYETTPLVRNPINTFAQQVVGPGYRVTVESDKPESERAKPNPQEGEPNVVPGEASPEDGPLDKKQRKELEEWLEGCAIIEKEPDKDIRHMLKKAVIQREVRGTCLIEKVYAAEDSDKLYGLAFLNAETVRPNTRPGQPMLLLPDDDPSDFDNRGEFPRTEDGKTAAYTQYTTDSGYGVTDPNSDEVNNFSLHDVLKLTRDADVNEAWGTSRIEAVSAEIEGLKNKMRDQNEAIASKAYPLWLFMFGSEERPWDADDIQRFMKDHEMDEFHPGLKQGVRGDVDLETISGEVADIIDYLEFDVNYIMSAMPLPKYALGAFESNINQFVSRTQERQVNRQIEEARRELETEFSEVVQQKAKEKFDLSDEEVKKIKLKLGHPGEEYQKQKPNQTNINYNGKGNNGSNRRNHQGYGGRQNGANGEPDDPSKDSEDDAVGDTEENTVWDVDLNETSELSADCSDGSCEVEELADPRLVGTSDVEDDLANLIAEVMIGFRDLTIQQLRGQFSNAPKSASMGFEGLANTRLNTVFRNSDFTDSAKLMMKETVQRTLDTLEQDNQKVTMNTSYGYQHQRSVTTFAKDTRESTRDAMEQLINRMDDQIERGARNDESLDRIINRVKGRYSDDHLRQRAQLIARMSIQRAIESTKMTEFERSDDVAGVKIINPCNDNTTPLCEHLAGCDAREGAVASFSDGPLSEQWEEQVNDRLLFSGFDPIPPVPPFHFNCRSGLIPVSEESLEEARSEQTATNVGQLENKYDVKLTNE